MSFLEEIQLEHNPLADSKVFAALFRDVQNVDFLQSQLLARNADFEYAFIDASTIFSRQQLLSAVFRALVDLQANQLSTPNVHSEVVLSLSPSNNVRHYAHITYLCPFRKQHSDITEQAAQY